MAAGGSRPALLYLRKELKLAQQEGVEGVKINLSNKDNLFEWAITIFGPPQTLYEGGYFKLLLRFPHDYPFAPPSVRFLTEMFHPNIYDNGYVCISILHPPGQDKVSGEKACEKWSAAQNVRTILLSIVSLLNEPNEASLANVEAGRMYIRWKNSNGQDKEYENRVRKLVAMTNIEAGRDGVQIPLTIEEYLATGRKECRSDPEPEDDYDFYLNSEC